MRRSGISRTRIVLACGARGLWGFALGGLACCLLLALGAAPAGATITDLSGPAFQILAPGEAGSAFPTEFSSDQGELYNKLTPLQGKVTAGKLPKDYVSEKFTEPGAPGQKRNSQAAPAWKSGATASTSHTSSVRRAVT